MTSGLINTSRQVGGAVGLAVLAAAATAGTSRATGSLPELAALHEGFRWAFLAGSSLAASLR